MFDTECNIAVRVRIQSVYKNHRRRPTAAAVGHGYAHVNHVVDIARAQRAPPAISIHHTIIFYNRTQYKSRVPIGCISFKMKTTRY